MQETIQKKNSFDFKFEKKKREKELIREKIGEE